MFRDYICVTASVQRLPKDLHVLALDLMGHGESFTPAPEEDLSFDAYVHSIKQVTQEWHGQLVLLIILFLRIQSTCSFCSSCLRTKYHGHLVS